MKRKNDMLMVMMRMVLMLPVGPKDKGVGAFENQGNMCLKHQQH